MLTARGHAVACFSPADERNPASPWAAYFPTPADYTSGKLITRICRFPRMVYSRQSKESLRRLLHDFQPDVVHVFAIHVRLTPSILDACSEAGIPVVMTCHDYKHICPNALLFTGDGICEACRNGYFYHAALNRCLHDSLVYSVAGALEAYAHALLDIYRRNIRTFLCPSVFLGRKTEEFWGPESFRWRVLRNPFDAPAYAMQRGSRDYILYIGRLSREKGVQVLIRAMAQCPDVKLKIVGAGPYHHPLRALCDTVGAENVEILGPRWGEDKDALIGESRFVVVPSVWHENSPYVVLEAFAAGKAVIGTQLGGIPEYVRDGEFGLISPAQDVSALAECINRLWRDPELALWMGANAKAWADRHFNDSMFYESLMAAYDEALEPGSRTRVPQQTK